jgi:hypothetical protein
VPPQVVVPPPRNDRYREGMKRWVGLAAAALCALSLSGCAVIGAAGQQTAIDVALSGLSSGLEAEHGVTATTTKQMDAEYRFRVTVTIDEVPRDKRVAVITAVDEVLAGSAFDGASAWFGIGGEALPVYSQNVFGLDTLESDLDYWSTVEDAVGEIGFGISDDPDGDGPLTRARSVYRETPMDYGPLVDIELDDTALDSWGSLGVTAVGSLPSAETAAVLSTLAETIPLRDYANLDEPLSISLDWSTETGATWFLLSTSLKYDQTDPETLAATDPTATRDWPVAVAVASRIAGAGIQSSLFGYTGTDNLGGIVWFGECGTEPQANDADEALFAALQTAGVVMPAGSAPGWCSGG